MERLKKLFREVDETTSTNKKVDSLVNYFKEAPPEDACWALHLISGNKVATKVNRTFLQETFCEWKGIPLWLFEESYYHVGDLSETMALLRGPIGKVIESPRLGEFISN